MFINTNTIIQTIVLSTLLLLDCYTSFKRQNFVVKNNKFLNSLSESQGEKEQNVNKKYHHQGTFPRLEYPNDAGQLTWYPIGFSKDFSSRTTKVTIRDVNYVVWKDKKNYYGIRDCCSHQGSSFMLGQTCGNTISCPYHGYIFDGKNGNLMQIPDLLHIDSNSHNVDCFKVVEKGDMVYFNTVPISGKEEEMRNKINEGNIFVEPEYDDKSQRVVFLHENFEHNAKLVSVNSLDICHIGFVHTFGNKKNPNPFYHSKITKHYDYDNHYKIVYKYIAGKKSLVNTIYNFNEITVENEYVLPHTTVARVLFGNYTSTIITHALPVSKFKTKLFVKAYRNYWNTNLNDKKNHNIFFPLLYLTNVIGDKITQNTMIETLKQDKSIVDFIDKTDYTSMHGKFSILYDMFSNHYKQKYNIYYESGPLSL